MVDGWFNVNVWNKYVYIMNLQLDDGNAQDWGNEQPYIWS